MKKNLRHVLALLTAAVLCMGLFSGCGNDNAVQRPMTADSRQKTADRQPMTAVKKNITKSAMLRLQWTATFL